MPVCADGSRTLRRGDFSARRLLFHFICSANVSHTDTSGRVCDVRSDYAPGFPLSTAVPAALELSMASLSLGDAAPASLRLESHQVSGQPSPFPEARAQMMPSAGTCMATLGGVVTGPTGPMIMNNSCSEVAGGHQGSFQQHVHVKGSINSTESPRTNMKGMPSSRGGHGGDSPNFSPPRRATRAQKKVAKKWTDKRQAGRMPEGCPIPPSQT